MERCEKNSQKTKTFEKLKGFRGKLVLEEEGKETSPLYPSTSGNPDRGAQVPHEINKDMAQAVSFCVMRFYLTKTWQHKRELILKRDNYTCQYYKRYGRTVPADTVHHIFPVEDYPQYKLENWNLISLSAEAHNKMHDRNTNQLTEEGKALLVRVARKRGVHHGNQEGRDQEDHGKETDQEDGREETQV